MRAVFPPGIEEASRRLGPSPAVASGGHLFPTGLTGAAADGSMPADLDAQFEAVFDELAAVLGAGGGSLADLVETTSYHVGIEAHFDAFLALRLRRLSEPFPAWTAVEVAGPRRPGALVELRAVARPR